MSSHNDSFAASGSSPTQREEIPFSPDFLVENHVSIFLIHPLNESARAWLKENIDAAGSFQPYWPTVVVEHRYIWTILDGIQDARLAASRG
jgi:hypothetical protein